MVSHHPYALPNATTPFDNLLIKSRHTKLEVHVFFRKIKALARQFEEKYGGATEKIRQKKKARKLDDYADLGFGYDSNDPFIDNSDVHDEIVPENLTTAHGGFYVNYGALEFKARESADEDSDVEAVLAESEKAAKKQKGPKKTTSTVGPPPKKKAKESSQNCKVCLKVFFVPFL